jgi:hypothetical protein
MIGAFSFVPSAQFDFRYVADADDAFGVFPRTTLRLPKSNRPALIDGEPGDVVNVRYASIVLTDAQTKILLELLLHLVPIFWPSMRPGL